MSATASEPSLGRPKGRRVRRRASLSARTGRAPALVAFVAFAAYGLLRWQTMLPSSMRERLAGLLALATVAAALACWGWDGSRGRRAAVGAAIAVGALAMIPMSGLPLHWMLHVRIAVTARALWAGISAVPTVTVPYAGHERSTRTIIALGAGLLALAAGLTLAAALRLARDRLLITAAVPLLVLALLPSMLGRPRHVYLHGVIVFALLVAFVLGRQLVRRRALGTTAMVGIAALLAVVAVRDIHLGAPRLVFGQLVGGLGPAAPMRFDWAQTYGPLTDTGGNPVVLDVRAAHPAYWKAEDLDEFDGTAWRTAAPNLGLSSGFPNPYPGIDRAYLRRWRQTLTVTVQSMRTSEVIGAGASASPLVRRPVPGVIPGAEAGTWTLVDPLTPGTRYTISSYTPRPTAAELGRIRSYRPRHARGAGRVVRLTGGALLATRRAAPAPAVSENLSISLPAATGTQPPQVRFAAYGRHPAEIAGGSEPTIADDRTVLLGSPLGGVYQLALALRSRTRTPYAYVRAVEHYLRQNYTYSERPPRRRNPLVAFLLQTHIGYCQQFAGAMALLLRMGGVPARVAVGFTTGTYDLRQREYVVRARDAHAWVEVWFPGYGWLTFDPTAAAKRRTGTGGAGAGAGQQRGLRAGDSGGHSQPRPRSHPRHAQVAVSSRRHGGSPWALVGLLAAILAAVLAAAGAVGLGARRRRSTDAGTLVDELEAAFARCGRPLRAGETLATLEQGLTWSPLAREYVARLRLARYAADRRAPTLAQRRAMRSYLRAGAGGRLRVLLALPPWR